MRAHEFARELFIPPRAIQFEARIIKNCTIIPQRFIKTVTWLIEHVKESSKVCLSLFHSQFFHFFLPFRFLAFRDLISFHFTFFRFGVVGRFIKNSTFRALHSVLCIFAACLFGWSLHYMHNESHEKYDDN